MISCPQCGTRQFRVVNTRTRRAYIYRMRHCACGFRQSFVELPVAEYKTLLHVRKVMQKFQDDLARLEPVEIDK